jgi:(p)ppGpp synthase/HD superfamily hydrolase
MGKEIKKSTLTINARDYAIRCHQEANHLYGTLPYAHHLNMVVRYAFKYRKLMPLPNDIIYAACWCHDVIEDTRQTYNDVKDICGFEVAEIVYAVTNEKGRTRAERAGEKYYKGIPETVGATFVKLCDRLANVQHNVQSTDAMMLKKYRNEHDHFVKSLGADAQMHYGEMFLELDQMLAL